MKFKFTYLLNNSIDFLFTSRNQSKLVQNFLLLLFRHVYYILGVLKVHLGINVSLGVELTLKVIL